MEEVKETKVNAQEARTGILNTDKPREKKKVNTKYLRDKDREMVKGIFRFYEVPGGSMQFVFRAYKEDPVETYTMVDGHVYTVPLGVARHLNKNVWYPVHGHMQDENGIAITRTKERIRRCSFQSLEFVDVDDLTPEGKSVIEATNL